MYVFKVLSMLDWWDFLILGVILFLSCTFAFGLVIYYMFHKGIQYFKVVINNDLPHIVDRETGRVMTKVLNKMKSVKMLNAKQGKAAGKQEKPTMLETMIGFAMSPQGQEFLGQMFSRGGPPPGPHY